ncbi:MAG: glycosyltransferase [Flammeovirgaceae bacterium]|nr:MAG: glycosyltransferase [Flammeovirgaceae bacterium]
MAVVVLSIVTLYFLLLVFLILSWNRPVKVIPRDSAANSVSVIIPVRNEERTITDLLDDISKQTHKPLEVIVVNDHSTDNTKSVVEAWLQQSNALAVRIIEMKDGVFGKKKAVTEAIAQAKGDVVVATDGDCRVGKGWLKSIATCFSDETVKLVAGAVKLRPQNFFGELQQLELAALTGITAAFITAGKPIMCSGANLAYRKEVFFEVKGYEGNDHVASGDDEFLLKKIASRYPQGIAFNYDPAGIVTTQPASGVSEFISQRIRWAGKWRQQPVGISSLVALFIFLFHTTYLFLPVLGLFWVVSLGTLSALVLLKLLLEFICLKRISNRMNMPFNSHAFAALQFLYPPYVVFFGLISNWLSVTWKGRKI